MRLVVSLATLLLAVGISAPPAQADSLETIAYEGFDYSAGSLLTGLDGGQQWSDAWAYAYSGGAMRVSGSGLSYTGLATEGLASVDEGVSTIDGSGRKFAGVSTGTAYLQLLVSFPTASFSNGSPTVRLKQDGVQTGALGNNNSGDKDAHILSAAGGSIADSNVSVEGGTHLLVLRINFDSQETDLWVDPTLATFDYLNPPSPDTTATSFAPAFNRIDIFGRGAAVFDEIKVMRVVSGSAGTSRPGEPPRESLQLQTPEGVTCSNSSVTGTQGSWMNLPGSDECTVTAEPDKSVLGWATIPNFPVEIAQRQVDNGWGAYELFDEEGRLIAVFIPAGGATFVSNSSSLYPIMGR